jgi:hypothetical protein
MRFLTKFIVCRSGSESMMLRLQTGDRSPDMTASSSLDIARRRRRSAGARVASAERSREAAIADYAAVLLQHGEEQEVTAPLEGLMLAVAHEMRQREAAQRRPGKRRKAASR